MSGDVLAFAQPGALVSAQAEERAVAVRWAMVTEDRNVKVKLANGKLKVFEATSVTLNPRTDRMVFVSDGVHYTLRELRSADGLWLSALKIKAPVQVLEDQIRRGDLKMEESLVAYAIDDSPYIVGLVYFYGGIAWNRMNGDWVQLSADDQTFDASNIEGIVIDPARGQAFIDLYDKNFVSVSDATEYESADSEALEVSESSDE